MSGEKETEMQIPDMSQLEIVDMFSTAPESPPKGKRLWSTKMRRKANE